MDAAAMRSAPLAVPLWRSRPMSWTATGVPAAAERVERNSVRSTCGRRVTEVAHRGYVYDTMVALRQMKPVRSSRSE